MLGKLEKVKIREIWKHEALDFTTWLAKEENIELLSDAIKIDIDVIETEASVGQFNVDILAKNNNTESKIIIENQLERTDHDHLGKIITYASGFDAETIIWLVKEAREEHKKAIEWLNNHLDGKINIFLVEIEVWKIGNSKPAVKFNVIESPNEWAKTTKNISSVGKTELTETKRMQLDFWTKLKEYGEDQEINLKFQRPYPQTWYSFAVGSSQYCISATINRKIKKLGVEIYIHNNKELYYTFLENKEKIENILGFNMEWENLEGKKASRARIYKDFELKTKESWEENFKWILDKVINMKKVFKK